MDDKWTIDDIYSEDSDDEIKLHPGAIRYRNDFLAKIWKRKRNTSNETKVNNEVDYNDRNPLSPAFTREQHFSNSSGLDLYSWKPWRLHFAENERKIWMGSFKPVTPIREEFVEYNNKMSTSTHTVKSTSSNSHERKFKTTTNCHGKLPPIPTTTSTVFKIPRKALTNKEACSSELKRPVKSRPTSIDGHSKSHQNVMVGNPPGFTKPKKSDVTSIVKHTGPSRHTKPIQRKQPESSEPNEQPGLYLRDPWCRYPGENKQKKWMGDLKAVTPTRDKYSYVRNDNKKLTNVAPCPFDCTSLRTSYEKDQEVKKKHSNV